MNAFSEIEAKVSRMYIGKDEVTKEDDDKDDKEETRETTVTLA